MKRGALALAALGEPGGLTEDNPGALVGQRAFPSGFGQSDTRARILNEGTKDARPNPSPWAGTPYNTITEREIVAMMADPQKVPKDKARWFMPSTYAEHDARSSDVQRERGQYLFLPIDIDDNDLSLEDVVDALNAAVPGVSQIVYTSRSAKASARRWRALVPLAAPLSGADYRDTQEALFSALEAATEGVLIPCRGFLTPAQPVYLPNAGEHYEHYAERGQCLDLTDHPIARLRDQRRAERAQVELEAQRRREQRARERVARAGDDARPVDHFNEQHTVEQLLGRYRYKHGGGDDWRSPMQSSGSYATRSFGDYWTSLSASDAVSGIGAASKTGHRFGDAFDLFVHFEHGGNFTEAVRAYAQEAGLDGTQQQYAKGADIDCCSKTQDKQGAQGGGTLGHESVEDEGEFDLSHDALALDLGLRSWDHDARYVATWGRWVFWAGTHWAKDDALDCMTRTRVYLRNRADELAAWAERKAEAILTEEGDEKKVDIVRTWAKREGKALRSKGTVAAVEAMAQSNPRAASRAVDFDANLMILGTPGGAIDLQTGDVRPSRREDMLTKLAAVAPAPPGTIASRWLAFLDEIFAGDQDVIAFMQRAAGYALTGLTTEHKLLFLYGTGRNGKSVFLDTLQWLLGDYARRAPATTFLYSTGERHPTDLAGLHGARLVVGSELPKGKTWDESVIKDLTGGDKMTARFMRQDFFDFMPQLTLMIAGNCQPSFRGIDEAIRARVVLIPFKVTIPAERRDKDLTAKLRAEGPAILRWAIEGALAWQKRGLDVPASVAAASADYLDGEDVLAEFLLDCTITAPGAFTPTNEIHARFKFWTESQGLGSWTSNTITKELKSRGFQDARRNNGRGFLGFRMA